MRTRPPIELERRCLLGHERECSDRAEPFPLSPKPGIFAEGLPLAGDIDVVAHAAKVGRWQGDSPEEVDLSAAHYLMTPWHALQMALVGEKRALEFFTNVVETAKDAKIKQMAGEFVEEEAEHVNLVHRLLRKYPAPAEGWAEDDDPPNAME